MTSETHGRFKRWFWRPPRAHGETIADRQVSVLELFYDLVYVAVIGLALGQVQVEGVDLTAADLRHDIADQRLVDGTAAPQVAVGNSWGGFPGREHVELRVAVQVDQAGQITPPVA